MLFKNWKRTAKMLSKTLDAEIQKRFDAEADATEARGNFDHVVKKYSELTKDNVRLLKENLEKQDLIDNLRVMIDDYKEDIESWRAALNRERKTVEELQKKIEELSGDDRK